ncbi:DUF4442 domain-containing protein [Gemmatimonas sp.]|uniref:hotdog fold domain-containing protein n=1 Tax=Gemmatimonas sp. TaxID=1962908 RepID=UPI003DA48B17
MARANPSPGGQLLRNWQRFAPLPFGKRLFSWAVGQTAPYTGSVGGVYTDVRPGYARVELADRRAVRNHLASVHAVALVNLAEMTSGVALMTALPPGVRGIVTGLSIEYVKKARGRLVCETHAHAPTAVTTSVTHDVGATITDCRRRRRGPRHGALASLSSGRRMTLSSALAPDTGTALTRHAHIRVPLICGPMYPCSNPELVASVSKAGGLGIVQPISLTYVHGYDFREGLRRINTLSGGAPIGFNALIEASSKTYHNRMVRWVETALEEGVRFFLTVAGQPAMGLRPRACGRRRGVSRHHRNEVGAQGARRWR